MRIDGVTEYKFDTLAEAKEKAGNLNAIFSLTAPKKKAIVIGDYGK